MTHLKASFTWMTSSSSSDVDFSLQVTRNFRKGASSLQNKSIYLTSFLT